MDSVHWVTAAEAQQHSAMLPTWCIADLFANYMATGCLGNILYLLSSLLVVKETEEESAHVVGNFNGLKIVILPPQYSMPVTQGIL